MKKPIIALLMSLFANGCSEYIIIKMDTRVEEVISVVNMNGMLIGNSTAIFTYNNTYVVLGTVNVPKTIRVTTTNKYTLGDGRRLRLIHSTGRITIGSNRYDVLQVYHSVR